MGMSFHVWVSGSIQVHGGWNYHINLLEMAPLVAGTQRVKDPETSAVERTRDGPGRTSPASPWTSSVVEGRKEIHTIFSKV